MQQGGSHQQVAVHARVPGAQALAQHGHANAVLDQPAQVRVMPIAGARHRAPHLCQLRVVGEGLEYVPQAGVDHLICQPQYEPEHVLRVAMALRQQVNILISSLGRAQRPHPQHALAAAGGHLAGHPNPVALFKLPRKPVGFIEDDCRDGAGGITKGERQIRRALARHAALLAPHGEHPLNGAAWFQSGHRPDPNDPVRGR